MFNRFHYWLYPELDLFRSDGARATAAEKIKEVMFKNPGYWGGMVVVTISLVYALSGISAYFRGNRTGAALIQGFVVLLVVMIVFMTVINAGTRRQVRRALRELLREQSIRICVRCGRDLSRITGANCPECGQPHGLTVG